MKKIQRKNANSNVVNANGKEEISMELAELGNLHPKQEPMTPNQREKSEREKPK